MWALMSAAKCRRYRKWSAVPMCLSGRQTVGTWHLRKSGLACRQEDCSENEHSTSRAARSQKALCAALPLVIGSDKRDMIGFLFDGWGFDFSDALAGDDSSVLGEKTESAIVGSDWNERNRSLLLMLLRD